MKRFALISSILLLLVVAVSACSPKEEVIYIEGEEREIVAAQAEPFLQHILDGIAQDDYALFTSDFDEAMLKAMTDTQFASIVKTMGKLGEAESHELSNVVDKDVYYGINYKVTYDQAVVNVLIILPKAEPRLVTGLWFK